MLRGLRNSRDQAPELRQSGRTDPPKIVTVLDDVFTRFDAIAERYRLEKIKTIDDAYMAVAGVPRSERRRRRGRR